MRYGLSYRDVEELLTERGIQVDHVTVYRWVHRFTPLLADAARFTRHSPGDRWFVDETYVKVNGVRRYVHRAIDQHGQVIDVLLSRRRDAAAARRFFTRALRTLKVIPGEVVTDAAPVYPGVLDGLHRSTLPDHRISQRNGPPGSSTPLTDPLTREVSRCQDPSDQTDRQPVPNLGRVPARPGPQPARREPSRDHPLQLSARRGPAGRFLAEHSPDADTAADDPRR
jgi:hypothetical protein